MPVLLSSIDQPAEVALWKKMTAIKQNILKRWDTSPSGVKVCCIKFVQKVVQVQTPGIIADPRVRYPLMTNTDDFLYPLRLSYNTASGTK